MDPAQHSDGCESETENDSAETFQVIPNMPDIYHIYIEAVHRVT